MRCPRAKVTVVGKRRRFLSAGDVADSEARALYFFSLTSDFAGLDFSAGAKLFVVGR